VSFSFEALSLRDIVRSCSSHFLANRLLHLARVSRRPQSQLRMSRSFSNHLSITYADYFSNRFRRHTTSKHSSSSTKRVTTTKKPSSTHKPTSKPTQKPSSTKKPPSSTKKPSSSSTKRPTAPTSPAYYPHKPVKSASLYAGWQIYGDNVRFVLLLYASVQKLIISSGHSSPVLPLRISCAVSINVKSIQVRSLRFLYPVAES